MTTNVTINPANHTVEVAIHDTASVQKEVLPPNSAPRLFYIYQGRTISVREIEPDASQGETT